MDNIRLFKLKKGDGFTLDINSYNKNKKLLCNDNFKVVNIYRRSFLPCKWLDRLKFWQWFHKKYVDVLYIGCKNE